VRRFHSAFLLLPSFSRRGQFIKDLLDARFAGFFPGPGSAGDGKNALKIAQPFMAGVLAHGHPKVPSGTKENAARSQLSSVPAGTLKFGGRFAQP
jgi:hypothetical protein